MEFCNTLLARQGYFDIFFPTDLSIYMYEYILLQLHSKFVAPVSPLSTSSNLLLLGAGKEFIQTDVDLSSTVLRNKESKNLTFLF